MSEQTLNRAMRGEGGPRINPHQESLIQNELTERRRDREYATQMAIEANQQLTDFDSIDTGQAIDTLQEPGFEPLRQNAERDTVPFGTNRPGVSDFDTEQPTSESYSGSSSDTGAGRHNQQSPSSEITEREINALLLIGAILYEATLIRKTEDTIQAQINYSNEFFITDSTIPERITDLLWTEYDKESRISYLKDILGDDTSEAINAIESLANELPD